MTDHRDARIELDPSLGDDAVARVRRALAAAPGMALIVDLRNTAALDVATLRMLGELADEAGTRQREILLTGAAPAVYKALHVAGLATRFRRV